MASRPMASPVKETKAQKSERLKRAMNPWDGLSEIRRFAREGNPNSQHRAYRSLLAGGCDDQPQDRSC